MLRTARFTMHMGSSGQKSRWYGEYQASWIPRAGDFVRARDGKTRADRETTAGLHSRRNDCTFLLILATTVKPLWLYSPFFDYSGSF
jgi:hypothetical protein